MPWTQLSPVFRELGAAMDKRENNIDSRGSCFSEMTLVVTLDNSVILGVFVHSGNTIRHILKGLKITTKCELH